MSGDRRAPWWYSGDDQEPMATDGRAPADADAGANDEADASDVPEGASSSMDWTALVAGAARMVDWATERVMAPHAEHSDPAEHPDCMVCRTVTLIGDPVGLMPSGPRPSPEREHVAGGEEAPVTQAAGTPGSGPVRWIPIVESRD
jgi:hypothetical protein